MRMPIGCVSKDLEIRNNSYRRAHDLPAMQKFIRRRSATEGADRSVTRPMGLHLFNARFMPRGMWTIEWLPTQVVRVTNGNAFQADSALAGSGYDLVPLPVQLRFLSEAAPRIANLDVYTAPEIESANEKTRPCGCGGYVAPVVVHGGCSGNSYECAESDDEEEKRGNEKLREEMHDSEVWWINESGSEV